MWRTLRDARRRAAASGARRRDLLRWRSSRLGRRRAPFDFYSRAARPARRGGPLHAPAHPDPAGRARRRTPSTPSWPRPWRPSRRGRARPGELRRRHGRQRARGQARAGGRRRRRRRGAGDDRARRQGPGGADRDPARHHHPGHAPRAGRCSRPPTAASCGRRARPTTAPPPPARARPAQTACDHEMPAPALRRPDPGARPADRLRGQADQAPDVEAAGTTLSSALVRPRRAAFDRSARAPARTAARLCASAPIPVAGARRRRGRRRAAPLPAWAARPGAGRAGRSPRYASPSHAGGGRAGRRALAAGRPSAASAAIAAATSSTGCCSSCPTSPPADRAGAAARLLARERDLDRRRSARRWPRPPWPCSTTRASPRCSGPGSRAEVAIAGAAPRLPAGLAVSGRVDRLVVETGPRAGGRLQDQPAGAGRDRGRRPGLHRARWRSMPRCCARSSPAGAIEAALVWTDGPSLMPVPENLMAQALDELAAIG